MYVNDLVYELRHCDANATLYADDAILYCTDSVLIFINYQAYQNVHSYNYLGAIVDDKLSFDEFVESKYNKINVRIYQLGKMQKLINSEIAITIYDKLFYHYLIMLTLWWRVHGSVTWT